MTDTTIIDGATTLPPTGAAGADNGTDTDTAADMLAALGKPQRLDIFRRLVRAGPEGLTVGAIGQALGMPPATLAHHLGTLVRAGLVDQERSGREVRCRPVFARVDAMIGFLTAECCADRDDACHREAARDAMGVAR